MTTLNTTTVAIDRSKLRAVRRAKDITTGELARSIRLSRRQYELKEKGLYSFKDYEMLIISDVLDTPIIELFF